MGNTLRKRAGLTAGIAALYLVTAFCNYFYRMGECTQMTFLSSVAIGIVYTAAAIEQSRGKDIPHFVYLDCVVLASSVVIMCAIFAPGVCFVGISLVPHLLMPIIVCLYYFAYCDGRACRARFVSTTIVFPTLYYVFMIAIGIVTGKSVYLYFDTTSMGIGKLILLGISADVMLLAVAVIFLCANKCFYSWKYKGQSDEITA